MLCCCVRKTPSLSSPQYSCNPSGRSSNHVVNWCHSPIHYSITMQKIQAIHLIQMRTPLLQSQSLYILFPIPAQNMRCLSISIALPSLLELRECPCSPEATKTPKHQHPTPRFLQRMSISTIHPHALSSSLSNVLFLSFLQRY